MRKYISQEKNNTWSALQVKSFWEIFEKYLSGYVNILTKNPSNVKSMLNVG